MSRPARKWRIGIDLGGTAIAGVLLDARGRVAAQARVPTPRDDYDATLREIVEIVARLEASAAFPADVGLGLPGGVDAHGLVRHCNAVWLNGQPLLKDLAALFGRGIACANDASLVAKDQTRGSPAPHSPVPCGRHG